MTFDDGTVRKGNLSFKAFQSLLRMKLTQKNGAPKPATAVTVPAVAPPVATATLAPPKYDVMRRGSPASRIKPSAPGVPARGIIHDGRPRSCLRLGRRHRPALLENDPILDELSYFVVQVVDFTVLAAKRQVYAEIREEKPN